MPICDSILPTEEYTIIAVLKSNVPDSVQLLWGIRSNDTLQSAFLTHSHFSTHGGYLHSGIQRDYSKWSICYYHTGCQLDTAKSYALWLGSTQVYYTDSTQHTDSLSSNVVMRELLYTSQTQTRVAKAAWQSYMAMKYGITLDYAPYVSPVGDTLWHHEKDVDYYHRVVAVGRDSTHEWSATKSVSSENASLLIQVADSLAEGEYILLGDNNMEESWAITSDGYNGLLRKWRLQSHVRDNHGCSLVWTPAIHIPYPDSVWIDIRDSLDNYVCRSLVDSIADDTAFFFTIPSMRSTQTLSIRTIYRNQIENSNAAVSYDASSGTLSLPMLEPDKVYSYALYTNLGHLLCWPAPSRPDCIQVGSLPSGIYRIEAFENNQMAASVPIIVR